MFHESFWSKIKHLRQYNELGVEISSQLIVLPYEGIPARRAYPPSCCSSNNDISDSSACASLVRSPALSKQ